MHSFLFILRHMECSEQVTWTVAAVLLEVGAVGEMMIEVGAPHGSWGPTRLTEQQLERVLTAMKDTAAAGGADVVVLRQGVTEVAAEGEQPGSGPPVQCCHL